MFIFIAFFLSFSLFADEFYLDYPSCRVRLDKKTMSLEKDLLNVLKDRLKMREFDFRAMPPSNRIGMEQLYLELEKKMVGLGHYKKCQMKLTLFVTKSDYISKKRDKKLFVKAIRRQYPRLTLGGKERCVLAIKDLFVHVPPCGRRPPKKRRLLNP